MSAVPPELPRLVFDEASLRFDGLAVGDLAENLDLLTDTLAALGRAGHRVFVCPLLYAVECLPGVALSDFLFAADQRRVSPDVTRRLAVQLDRCPSWTSYSDQVTGDVWIADEQLSLALSVDYALISGIRGTKVACIVFPACGRRGATPVRNKSDAAEIFLRGYFFATPDIVEFWRSLFLAEDVPESEFFALAVLAFPDLLFSPDLSFGKFAGSYVAVRDPVVVILAAINDRFAAAVTEGYGVPHHVQALLGQYGLDVSPESPKTRASQRLMRYRDVSYGGEVFRCEWHAKVERHRNRIHFTLPQPALENKILIGLFVEHLET